MKKTILCVVSLLVLLTLSACEFQRDVNPDQVAVFTYRNSIEECKGAGTYTRWGWYQEIEIVDRNTITLEVEDPEVATSNNQLVGARVTIMFRRMSDCASVTGLLTNWSLLRDDSALRDTVDANAREAIKNGVRGFTLTELLNDRNGLSQAISDQLELDTAKYFVEIVNVTIENIALDPEYAETLKRTAQLTAQEEYAQRRQNVIQQEAETNKFEQEQRAEVLQLQLAAEKAQTDVDVEIARREGEKIKAANQVYETNEFAYELRRLELISQILGDKTTMWFVDPNTDLTLILNGMEEIVPVPLAPQE